MDTVYLKLITVRGVELLPLAVTSFPKTSHIITRPYSAQRGSLPFILEIIIDSCEEIGCDKYVPLFSLFGGWGRVEVIVVLCREHR